MSKLIGIYSGNIKTFHNTPCKIAIFTDGKIIKVFQKEFFRNSLYNPNWSRNVNFEKYNNLKKIEEKLASYGFSK